MAYREIDAGMIGVPEDVVIDDDEVPRNGVAFVEDVLVDAFHVIYGDGERRYTANEAQQKS